MRNTLGLLLFLVTRIYARFQTWFWDWSTTSYLYKKALSCGSVRVYGYGRFINVHGLSIGENVHINVGAYWVCDGGLTIGDHTHIAKNCTIYTRNHNYHGNAIPYDDTNIPKPVHIGVNVWIGANVTILPGAHIGEGAIIGGGSVVYGRVAPFAIMGAPGPKQIAERDRKHYEIMMRRKQFGGSGGKLLSSQEESKFRDAK